MSLFLKVPSYLWWATFAVIVAVVFWSRYYYINPDGIDYIGIARLIRMGAWYDAVNAFRGPLISWLVAPLFVLLPELLAIRLIVAAGVFATILVCRPIIGLLVRGRPIKAATLATIMFMPLMPDAVVQITPDTLLSALALPAFYFGIRFIDKPAYRSALLCGLFWAAAYWAKSFAFTYGICFLALLWLLCVLYRPVWNITAISKQIAVAMIVLVVGCLPWMAALRHKYGLWMAGSAGRYNLFYMGTYPQRSAPVQNDSPWLTPELFSADNRMAGYTDHCPPGDAIYSYSALDIDFVKQLKGFLANLAYLGRSLWAIFGIAAVPIVIGLVLALRFSIANRQLVLLLLACILWILLYCIVLVQYRYLLPVAPLVVIAACNGYEAFYHRLTAGSDAAASGRRRAVALLLLLQVGGAFVFSAARAVHYVRSYYSDTSKHLGIARQIASMPEVRKIAQSSSCRAVVPYLAYLADVPYAGQIVLDRHRDDWLEVLKKGQVSHFVILAGELETDGIAGLEPVLEFAARNKHFKMFRVLYDDQ